MITAVAMFKNRPWSTTPSSEEIALAAALASLIGSWTNYINIVRNIYFLRSSIMYEYCSEGDLQLFPAFTSLYSFRLKVERNEEGQIDRGKQLLSITMYNLKRLKITESEDSSPRWNPLHVKVNEPRPPHNIR